MRPHRTYPRIDPPGLRVRRFRCPESGRTASRLPNCVSARRRGTLAEAEAVAGVVHPSRHYRGQASRRARRRGAPGVRLASTVAWAGRSNCAGVDGWREFAAHAGRLSLLDRTL